MSFLSGSFYLGVYQFYQSVEESAFTSVDFLQQDVPPALPLELQPVAPLCGREGRRLGTWLSPVWDTFLCHFFMDLRLFSRSSDTTLRFPPNSAVMSFFPSWEFSSPPTADVYPPRPAESLPVSPRTLLPGCVSRGPTLGAGGGAVVTSSQPWGTASFHGDRSRGRAMCL